MVNNTNNVPLEYRGVYKAGMKAFTNSKNYADNPYAVGSAKCEYWWQGFYFAKDNSNVVQQSNRVGIKR